MHSNSWKQRGITQNQTHRSAATYYLCDLGNKLLASSSFCGLIHELGIITPTSQCLYEDKMTDEECD